MPRRYLRPEDRTWKWEPLHGKAPSVYLASHPSRTQVAMQVSADLRGVSVERAAIWDSETHRIIWAPADALAIGWLSEGDRMLALIETYHPPARQRRVTSTPYQSDFTYRCDLLEWPSRRVVGSCGLVFPTGSLIDVIPSPDSRLAVYVWLDQTEAGFEFLRVDGDSVEQLPDRGYYGEENLIEGPVFSPDGRYAVAAYGGGIWWAADRYAASPGGERRAGWVAIADTQTGVTEERDVICRVKKGWRPEDPERIRNEMLTCPEFTSAREFEVKTANGEVVRFVI